MLGRFSRYFWLISSLLASTEANLLKTQGPTTLVGLLFTPMTTHSTCPVPVPKNEHVSARFPPR